MGRGTQGTEGGGGTAAGGQGGAGGGEGQGCTWRGLTPISCARCCRKASDGVRTSLKIISSFCRLTREIDQRGMVSLDRFW